MIRHTQLFVIVASFVGQAGYAQNVETSRLQLLNTLMCSSGELDAGTCAACGIASATANEVSANNGHAIMGGSFCDPRYAANCY
ncbi:MAG: hypothetical protein ACI9OJ_001572 [Myxococcota bacterium]|jgi:hypothetical protein